MTTVLAQLAAATTPAAAATNSAATEPIPWQVHLVGYLAWPVAALLIALVFWRPLSAFIASIGGRVTKLSVLSVGIELTPATSATETPLLNDLRDANAANVYDSSEMMLEQVQMATPADFAVIDIGGGSEWLTSRLFIAAIMLRRMRGVQVFAFVESTGSIHRRFIAIASVAQLRWILAREFPWLEAAWLTAIQRLFQNPAVIPAGRSHDIKSDQGAFDPSQARQITSNFIQALQVNGHSPTTKAPDWVEFDGGRAERAQWVTHGLLASILPPKAFQVWAPAMRDAPRAQRLRTVLRRDGDFIALVDEDHSLLRVVNRRAVLDEVATVLGEEPEGQGPKQSASTAQAS